MSNRLKVGKHLLLSCSALFPVLLAGVAPAGAQAVNLGGAGNLIVPDGRTGTNVSSSGSVTDIHTNTVRGQTGFNSFSKFEAGSGNTVNLHLPDGTGTLVNIVRDAPVRVEGTVNALKNGSIGGNVVFSDPYGFVLGKDGVINTGGLTVNTPTKEFLDQAIDAHGRIDTAKTDRLISGDVPLSPDGSVVIKGRVNAETHIDIHAQSIDVDGEAVLKRHRENFESSVNTRGGVSQGGALVVRNGRISLVAAGDVKVGGSVAARATSRESAKAGAGRVSIKARNVTVTPTARIEALAEIARETGADPVAAGIAIEASGALDIAGTVEARGLGGAGAAVNLSADRAAIKASALLSTQIEARAAQASVNMSVAGDLAFDGRIESRGAEGTKGGRIDLKAGRDIAMGAASSIDAGGSAGSAGGDVRVVATRDLTVADAASVSARGAGNADGGFAELSGHRALTLGAVAVDLRSDGGKAGTLLIDPADLVIDSANPSLFQSNLALTATNSITVKTGGSIRSAISNGRAYDISLQAKTITVENGGEIDARALDANRNVIGASGSITLSASTIQLLAGSTVRADGGNGFAAGTVTLLASDEMIQRSGAASASARIAIAGSLYGSDIKALAVARATSSFAEIDFLNPSFSLSVMDAAQAALLTARVAGMPALDGGFLSGTTVARVDVASTADIVATGNLSLQAAAQQVASNLGANPTTGSVIQLTAFYGTVDADTAVTIASGARLSAKGDLTVTARNNATLDVNAMSVGLKDTPISGAFAMGVAKIRTEARIAAGAIVKVDKDVRVAADNLNSFSVVSTVLALKDGVAGASIAVQDTDASATAALDAGVTAYTVAGKPGSVSLTALSETTLNKTGASTDLGDNAIQKLLRNPITDALTAKAGTKLASLSDFLFKNTPFAALSQDEMPKGGVGLSLMFGKQAATAEIGAGVSLDLAGRLAVASSVLDAQVRSNATASINSAGEAAQGPKTTTGVGIGVAYADVDHISHATIGNGATITAADVGLSAISSLPINITYVNNAPPSTPVEWIKAIITHANGNLGVVKNVLTSYASSDVEADDGLGATLNYLSLGHDVLSWIGSGASVTTTGTGTADWTTASLAIDPATDSTAVPRLSTGTVMTRVPAVTFKAGLDVSAKSDTATINIAGNPAWLLIVGGNASTDTDTGKSFGGALNLNVFSARTVAGIGAGARIASEQGVRVLAERADTIFAVAPTSGKGAGFGISGILSVLMVANETSASISDKAVVEAKTVSVEAYQRNKIVTIAGSLNRGSGTNVGIAANWSSIETGTAAFVGDNASLVAGTALANAAGLSAGSIRSTGVSVLAATTGETYGLSVAGAVASPDDGTKGLVAKGRDKIANKILPRYARVSPDAKIGGTLSKLSETLKGGLAKLSGKLAAPAPVGQSRDFSMSAAGSVSGASITATTEAYLDGATLISVAGAAYPVVVKATNDSLISTTSGAASLALSGQTAANKSAAVAGAVAIAMTDGATRASIRNASLTDVASTAVLAIASGQQIVIGLGLSVNTNAGAQSTLAIAGSVSLGLVFDNVNASVENSVVTAKAGANADLDVKAYQNTDIGIGGLAISVATSGSGGYGLAVSGTVIADSADPTNPSNHKAVSATLLNSSVTNVRNLTVDAATLSRVMSGAAAIGAAPNGLGVSGSIVFNDISGTTLALIKGRGAGDRIDASGSVLVRSGSVRETAIEGVLSSVVRNTAIASGFDFSRNAFDADSSGAVIFALSAAGAGGKNAGGVALLYNGVRHAHTARIEGVDLRAGGDVTVAARDDTKIIGTAVGISVATGDFGGAGSIVIEVVANKTDASIAGAGTVLAARDIAVLASNTSEIKGGAGSLGVGLSAQGTGLGLSLINGTVANRTTATIEAASLTATRDVDLSATSKGDILTFSVNVGVGNAAGIAGSIATQVSANDAQAIVRAASVTAENNVSVAASNEDRIQVTAGAVGVSLKGAGVGVSTSVNVVRGDTTAAVEAAGGVASTIVAKGLGTAKTVNDGKVLTAYDLGGAAATANTLIALTPDLQNGTRTVSGLSVNAISRQKVGTASLSVGVSLGSGIAVSLNPILNVLGGTTEARISDSNINRTNSSGASADVTVIAASNTFVQNGLITVAGSGGAAGGAGFSTNTMQRTTSATVSNALIGASGSVGAVDVFANGTMTSVNLVAGLSIGGSAAAGSMVANVFDARTTAQLSGGTLAARALTVKANGDSAFLGAAGAGAGGGMAGAGAMNLAFNLGSTRAVVGGVDTVLLLDDDLTVDATSRDDHRAYVVGGAVGTSGFAVAGMLNFSVLMSDTIASVSMLRSSAMRDLSVTARGEVALTPATGGFAVSLGGAGVGAAVNVMLTKSTVAAELVDSTVAVRRDLSVEAYGVRKADMITATLGAGSSAGIGASIGVFVAGIGMSDDARTELGNTLTSANAQSNRSSSGSFGGSGTADYRADQPEAGTSSQKASDPDSLQRRDLVSTSLASTKRDGVTARISGGTISAGQTTVLADSRLEIANKTYGAGIGGAVGVGAALGFSFVDQAVTATVDSTLTAASLSVKAVSGMPGTNPAVAVKAYAGAGSLGGALGAAVAVADLDSDIRATVSGTVNTTGLVDVHAEDKLAVASEAVGAAASGGVAIGISLALADRAADITAELGAGASIRGASGVSVTASSAGSAKADSLAGAGGLLGAGVGASATALEASRVYALLGAGANLASIGSGGVTVSADATPLLSARSIGVAVGGSGAVGASVAVAKSTADVRALIGDATTIAAGGRLRVAANLLKGTGDSAFAMAVAGAGSLFFSAQASVAEALMNASTTARIGANGTLTLSNGDVEVVAGSQTVQRADVTGVSVSGGLSLGASVAEAKSDVGTIAEILDGASIAARNLTISADGSDQNVATSMAGGGGIVSGSAAVANTTTVSRTTATLGGGTASRNVALTGKLTVSANHLGTLGGSVDSINAGIVGASGAVTVHIVDATVTAKLADDARVAAADLDVFATNRTHRLFSNETGVDLRNAQPTANGDTAAWSVNSGSGGIVNLPAGSSRTTISHVTTAALGVRARVSLDAGQAASAANLAAYNEIIVHDKAKLDSGGLIALAETSTSLLVSRNDATVSFGAGSDLVLPNGTINAAAYDNAHLDLRAASTTYGLAGAPTGRAEIDYRRANLVSVAKGARLEASNLDSASTGTIRLAAGASLSGPLSRITANATLDLFNNTVIAIPTVPRPVVTISGNSILSIEGESNGLDATSGRVRAAGDVTLIASRGQIDARAVGTGKDIYRQAAAAIASGVSELFGGGPISFDYKGGETNLSGLGIAAIDGSVETGIRRSRSLLVEYAQADVGTCIVSTTACLSAKLPGQIDYTYVGGKPVATAIIQRLEELRKMLADYNGDPVARGAFSAEIAFLQAKLIAAGFSKDGTPGELYGETPYQSAVREIDGLGKAIASRDVLFATNATTGTTQAANAATAAGTLLSDSQALTTRIADAKTAADTITNDLKAFTGYDSGASGNDMTSIANALTSNAALVNQISTERAKISTSQTAVTNARTAIRSDLSSIETDRASLATLGTNGDPTTIQTIQDRIATTQQTIKTNVATIETELAAIKTATGVIAGKQAAIDANFATIATAQGAVRDRSGTAAQKAAVDTKLNDLGTTRTTIGQDFGKIGTGQTTVSDALTALAPVATAEYGANLTLSGALDATRTGRTALVTKLANEVGSLGTKSNAQQTPTTGEIQVADTVVRLGNISVVADRLEGAGALVSPGDASIQIVNRTGNNLVVGNQTILSDSGGRIRFNGALVDSTGDINAFNKVVAGRTDAQFRAVTTARTQGNTVPQIKIQNDYSSLDLSFYNPAQAAGNPLAYKTSAFYAPDLILKTGTELSNLTGSVAITSAQGNVYSNGSISAKSVSITAKNGDFVQSYTYGFQHVKGDPQTGTPAGTGIVANGGIMISARYLNVNGIVQSGMADRFVTIGTAPMLQASSGLISQLMPSKSAADLATLDQAYKDNLANNRPAPETYALGGGLTYRVAKGDDVGRLEFDIAYARTKASALGNDVRLVETDATGLGKTAAQMKELVGVTYDILNDRFVVDGTNVRGGQIEIYGQILNTSDQGAKLRVLDGFGQIKIANLSSRDVVIQRLDTGEDTAGTGRGVEGRIDITDIRNVAQAGSGVTISALKTSYRRELDTATNTYRVVKSTIIGSIASDGTFQRSLDQTGYGTSYGSDRTAGYDPLAGLRYLTLSGTDSSFKEITHYKGTQFFGSSDLRTAPTGSVVSSYSFTRDSYALPEAATVAVDLTHRNDALLTTPSTVSGNTTYVKTDEWRKCNWWTLCIASDYNYIVEATTPKTTITTASRKADYQIGVEFIGSDSGLVDVASVGNVLLAGTVANRSGSTRIVSSAGSIVQGVDGAMITSKSVDLSAAGSVGALATGKAIQLTLAGGALDAQATGGNVVVDARSDIRVGTIKAGGDATQLLGRVVLTSTGSITGTGTSLIQAPRVELTASSGSIGAGGSGLVVNTGFTSNAAYRPFGDPAKDGVQNAYFGLKAQAAGDIDIESRTWSGNTDATILVDRVVSSGGNVRLKTDGAILDNNPIQSVDTRTYGELLTYWNSLQLLAGTANAAKTAAVVRAFETQVAAEKRIYDQLLARSGTTAYDAAFVYRMSAAEQAGFEASVKLAEPGISASDLAARTASYVLEQTQRYHRVHASLASLTGTFDAGTGAYTASAAETAARSTGSVWTERQLAFSLSPGALKTITGTNPVLKDANVSGRVVTLLAGKGIGEVGSTVSIPINIDPSQLTDAQKIALATAERSDFLSRNTGDPIRIQAIRMLNFDAANRLDATVAAGSAPNAYLATLGEARLGAITVPGELRVKARGSIVNGGGDVAAGSYILEASGGGIGYSRDANGVSVQGTLTLKPVNTTGSLLTGYKGAIIARGSDAIDLSVAGSAADEGDANLDTVYSRKGVKIVAAKSIRNANGDKLINILGDTVELAASTGSIGSDDNRLNIGNGLAGSLDATAAGSIHLFAPDGNHLTLHDLVAGGGLLSVVAGDALSPASLADLTLSGSLSAATSVDLFATGRLAALGTSSVLARGGDIAAEATALRMLTGAGFTASGKIALATAGDALVTGLKAGSAASDAVRVTASGRILAGTAAGRTDIETTGLGSGVVLSALGGIGGARVANDTLDDALESAVAQPLILKTALADIRSRTGGLAATFLGDATVFARSEGGSVTLSALGRFASSFVGADLGDVRISAGGDIDIAALAAGNAVDVSGPGAIRVATTTGGGDVALVAGGLLDLGTVETTGTGAAVHLKAQNGDLDALRLASGGAIDAAATGSIRVGAAVAATSITADAGGGLTLRRGVSGGTQRLASTGDLVFDSLRTLGIATDPGDIYLTSREGAVLGGEVIANRDLFINAKKSLVFSKLKSVRDMSLTVGGALRGPDLDAGGELFLDVAGDSPIRLATLRSKMLKMSGAGPLTIDNAIVSEGATLEAPSITIGTLTYTGLDQLLLTLRGYRGAVANDAAMRILAPNGIRIDQLRVADSRFTTDASNVQVIDGYVPGTLELKTPDRTVWMNNRTPRPTLGNDIQLYRPDFTFGMDQSGNRTTTTSYVVRYGSGTDARMVWNGEVYPGSSFVRDFERAMQDASNDRSPGGLSQRSLTRMTVDAVMNLFRRALTGPVSAPLDGPAVRTSDDGDGDRREAAAR